MSNIYTTFETDVFKECSSKTIITLPENKTYKPFKLKHSVSIKHLKKKHRDEVVPFINDLKNDIYIHDNIMYFENEAEAIHFKLVWG